MNRFDEWLARTLFVPPIIAICQATGITQYAFYRYASLLFFMSLLWVLNPTTMFGWFIWGIVGLGTILQFISCMRSPDVPRPPSGWRFIWIALVMGTWVAVLLRLILLGDNQIVSMSRVTEMLILFAEYALTIPKIPPREDKKARLAKSHI